MGTTCVVDDAVRSRPRLRMQRGAADTASERLLQLLEALLLQKVWL